MDNKHGAAGGCICHLQTTLVPMQIYPTRHFQCPAPLHRSSLLFLHLRIRGVCTGSVLAAGGRGFG